RAGVEIIAVTIVAIVIGIRIPRAVEHEIERRIVTTGYPGRSATARCDGRVGPGFTTPFARHRHRVKAPDALPPVRIVRIDLPAAREISTGYSDDHFILHNDPSRPNPVAVF